MNHRRTFLCAGGFLAAAMALTPRGASAQEITWGPAFVAQGSGCSSAAGDAVMLPFGNDVAVLFSKFGVELPAGGPNLALADLKGCLVRIGATIKLGFKITTLTQKLTYGVIKTANTRGKVTTASSFFGLPVQSMSVSVGFGPQNNPSVTPPPQTDVFIVNGACNATLTGLFQSNMAVGGERTNANESLVLAVQGLDLRYDLLFDIAPCP